MLYLTIQGACDENDQPDQKNNDKTEFSLNHAHYDSYHEELTPLAMLNHLLSSPKPTAKDPSVIFPSHNRTFSL